MHDFEIHEARSRQAYGRFTWLVRAFHNWRMRKTLTQLSRFSDYQLRDIGLTRQELSRLQHLPLDVDIAWDHERQALLRAKYDTGAAGQGESSKRKSDAPFTTARPLPAWMTECLEGEIALPCDCER